MSALIDNRVMEEAVLIIYEDYFQVNQASHFQKRCGKSLIGPHFHARNMVDNDVDTFSGTNDDVAYIYMPTHKNSGS